MLIIIIAFDLRTHHSWNLPVVVIVMFGRRRGYRRGFGRGGGGTLGLMLLAMQLLHLFQFLSNSNEYYPISLGVLGLNLLAYFQPGHNWPSIQQACISVRGAWFEKQWKRLFLASFYHSSDFHLYYNMASFIWKAISLERHFGSGYFLYMVSVFSVVTNLVYVAINYALAEILDQRSYINSCAVGFSGVLFALKVITTHIQPAGMTRVMGFIPVPMRIACWVELVLISVLFPHVSFVGHLAGIVVGFAFVYGPLRAIMDIPLSLITDLVPSGTGTGGGTQYNYDGRSYTYRAGATGRRVEQPQQRPPQQRPPHSQRAEDTYQSYTYAARVTGHSDQNEDTALQEAIRRSLSSQSEERREGEGREGEEDMQAEEDGSPGPLRPPPYNPQFPAESRGSDTTAEPNVGWNQDLLEPAEDHQTNSPLGFDALESDPDSIQEQASGNTGTDLRRRRNKTRDDNADIDRTSEHDTRSRTRDDSSSLLTRQEIRDARLLRFGERGSGRERKPLSELASHSFTFKK